MTERETLEMFLNYGLSSPNEVFEKFLTLEGAKSYEYNGNINCVYVPGTRKDRVLLVAHADTVFFDYPDYEKPHRVFLDDDDIYISMEDNVGIGADDRAGCAILWLLRNSGHSLLITNEEEVGNNGALAIRTYHKELFAELNNHQYMIEFDRCNSCNYKVYDIPVTEEFKRFIELNTGYKEADKYSSTDITILCNQICGVNLSIGYYYEHTKFEYLDFREWEHTLNVASRMLQPVQEKYLTKNEITQIVKGRLSMIRMDKLIQNFADTQAFYTSDPVLKEAVAFSLEHTKLYKEDNYPELPNIPEKLGLTLTLNLRSFQAAMKFHKAMPDKKIAVLNFASPVHPGGGVFSGSRAQEECLCRCSTLYPLLAQEWLKESYYIPNKKAHDFMSNDTCIYSEGVVICKSDDEDFPKRLKPEELVTVDVITCAAPDWRNAGPLDYNAYENYLLHVQRAKHIMHIAALHNVDILVTGAFGCGAFKNEPDVVAMAWQETLKEYRKKFEYVIFAIYFREHEIGNFKAFNEKIE